MVPHTYATDAHRKSQDLAAAVLSAVSPPQIADACSAVDSFLRHHSPDQTRWFFSVTFPTLICRVFGFDDSTPPPPPQPPPSSSSSSSSSSSPMPKPSSSSNAWIEADDPDLASRVFALLSPSGVLMSSISSVDRLSLVKYVFPVERLPAWARFVISSERDCRILSDLCSVFKGRVREDSVKGSSIQVQLNVFEYYMFWFAYCPVCRESSNCSSANPAPRSRMFGLERFTSSFSVFSGPRRGSEQKIVCTLYTRLLYAYLRSYVPIYDLNTHHPYRSSLLHYPSGYDGSVVLQAEFFVDTLTHFWLVYNDFSSLSINVCKFYNVSFPLHLGLDETPPAPGLGGVVKLFVKYLNLSLVSGMDVSDMVDCSGSPRWMDSGWTDRNSISAYPCIRSWNSWIQRPLYRFLLRTFLFYPVGNSMKNASEVFSVWLSYMEPWAMGIEDFCELDSVMDKSDGISKNVDWKSLSCGYSSSWKVYVLSNYLFYTSLVIHFIGFAHKFLHTNPEVIVPMVSKVMSMLTSSKELIDLIKNVDAAFHCKNAGSGKVMFNTSYRFVPLIRQQLQDWEDGLCERDADGSFLHENWNRELRLFSDNEDGGQQLLQLFILRAESELQSNSGDNLARNLQCMDSLKSQVGCLFGDHIVKPMPPTTETRMGQLSRVEMFTPRRVGNRTLLNDVNFKGDWMQRPVSDDEIVWLAKLLVWVSGCLNEGLGLNQVHNAEVDPKQSYVDVSEGVVDNICGPRETLKVLLNSIGSWLLMLGLAVAKLMRSYGLRVNLRVFASKKFVMILFVAAVAGSLKRAIGQMSMVSAFCRGTKINTRTASYQPPAHRQRLTQFRLHYPLPSWFRLEMDRAWMQNTVEGAVGGAET